MSDEKNLEPLPLCEQCWLGDHTRWEPASIDENGTVAMELVSVELPATFSTGSIEMCCMCGNITISGIYSMLDPSGVYFDSSDEEEGYMFDLESKLHFDDE